MPKMQRTIANSEPGALPLLSKLPLNFTPSHKKNALKTIAPTNTSPFTNFTPSNIAVGQFLPSSNVTELESILEDRQSRSDDGVSILPEIGSKVMLKPSFLDSDNSLTKKLPSETSLQEDVRQKDMPSSSNNEELAQDDNSIGNKGVVGNVKKGVTVKSKVKGYATMTMMGKLITNPNKKNQDARLIIKDFNSVKNCYLLAVLDGHGHFGHLVSHYVKQRLPLNLELLLPSPAQTVAVEHKVLEEAVKKTNEDLLASKINVMFSGTTLVAVLLAGDRLICANVGDSRAVVGKLRNSQWTAHAISRDHKPDSPQEYERIINSNGRVQSYMSTNGTPLGPKRVWKKDENVPGLAMSRALGDRSASEAGVICTPEIVEKQLDKEDKLLVLASDGVWEHMENEEAVEIVGNYWERNSPKDAVERLVREARARWESELAVDDITAIVVFFK
eukprot:TRINITY_DN9878_c0_g1_i9.p1 TRINITY_DN9878_c0_g1~~TRINITY_DN9878_c0_g1_i9.p1  ORF type:complete len:446 (-),score=94.89 TRINITY_DN9878_c0_g1_i9:875-2212(-)